MRLVHLYCAMAMVGFAAPALAQEGGGEPMERPEAATVEVDFSDLEVLEKTAPHFPRDKGAYKDDVTCAATVVLGISGTPEDVRVDGCPELFARNTKTALEAWKFKPTERDGERVKVTFTKDFSFNLQTTAGDYTTQDLAAALSDHEDLEDFDGDHCAVKVTVFADGTTGKLRSSQAPRCMVLDSEYVKYPGKLIKSQTDNVRCVVKFKAEAGEAGDVTFGECPDDYQKYAEKMVGKWTWQTASDKAVKYEARLFFNAKAE